MADHKERANNSYTEEQNSCPAPGTCSVHIWVLFAGGASYSRLSEWAAAAAVEQKRRQQVLWKSFSTWWRTSSPSESVLGYGWMALMQHLHCFNLDSRSLCFNDRQRGPVWRNPVKPCVSLQGCLSADWCTAFRRAQLLYRRLRRKRRNVNLYFRSIITLKCHPVV